MDKCNRTEVSWREWVGDNCVRSSRKNPGVTQGNPRLLTKLGSECDRVEHRSGENFVEEVRLVENIVAVGRIVVCGPIKRRLGGAIMAGLVFASLVTWTIFVAKFIELFIAKRKLRAAMNSVADGRTLGDASSGRSVMRAFVVAAIEGIRLSPGFDSEGGIKERGSCRQPLSNLRKPGERASQGADASSSLQNINVDERSP
jgi:hypothetical protein